MTSWRDEILKEFAPRVSQLTLVADPDALLLEEKILERIQERGFKLITFEDHVAFRYAYEREFRSYWDQGQQTELVVMLRAQASNLDSLPFDLLQVGRRLSFSLGDIFPNFSYRVVAALDRGEFDALYDAQRRHAPGVLGDNATKEFVLRHVFEIVPELIKQPSDLLRVLLRLHYRGRYIPDFLDERLIQLLRQNSTFDDWPLEIIIPDREAFFTFLQERWRVFLDRMVTKGKLLLREGETPYDLTLTGPIDLPFDHHDVRVYMDNLFLEGLLRPVNHERSDMLSDTWVNMGVRIDEAKERHHQLVKLLNKLQSSVPTADARYEEWLDFARGWAKFSQILFGSGSNNNIKMTQSVSRLQEQVGGVFKSWLVRRYAGLINLPPVPPVMLHHLPRLLARYAVENRKKVALVLIDGLSLGQWMVVREALEKRQPNLRFRENSIFAWIPSLTSVSRQACFAGKPPVFFPDSIHSTNKEQALWEQFWVDQGYALNEVAYAKGLGDGRLDHIVDMISHPKVRVAGLVIDKVDKIMHGIKLGSAGMYNQVRQWAQQPYMAQLLNNLLNQGFQVFLTSDHGNVEAEGCGSPAEGAVAELRGQRVRVYSDKILRSKVKERFPAALEWQPVGLPDTFLTLIAPARQAFVREGEQIVCHGGISIEEIIVPLIQIERKDR